MARLSENFSTDWQLPITYQNSDTGGWCSPLVTQLAGPASDKVLLNSVGQETNYLDGKKKCTYVVKAATGAPGFRLKWSTYFNFDLHYIEYKDSDIQNLSYPGITDLPDPMAS